MTSQNLFEKYGIKEVADVTFYRIEKKEETFEAQRDISVASILKGAVELQTVYPMENGAGSDEGFEAYVFSDASIITGTNYDCDDTVILKQTYTTEMTMYSDTGLVKRYYPLTDTAAEDATIKAVTADENDAYAVDYKTIVSTYLASLADDVNAVFDWTGTEVDTAITNFATGAEILESTLKSNYPSVEFKASTNEDYPLSVSIKFKLTDVHDYDADNDGEIPTGEDIITVGEAPTADTEKLRVFTYSVSVAVSGQYATSTDDVDTGVYSHSTISETLEANEDIPDNLLETGTHEYTYPEQILMQFARKQNLIAKTGVRYHFEDADTIFGDITFNDNFAAAPNSVEQIVVVGLDGKMTENTYEVDEVKEAMDKLTDTFKAKAYDVVYEDYAELVVEDEMGYYNPLFLGDSYVKSEGTINFFAYDTKNADTGAIEAEATTTDVKKAYEKFAKTVSTKTKGGKGVDKAIANAVMWGRDIHYSINDAIDALRQKKLILDESEANGLVGINSIFGGYRVSDMIPEEGKEDTDYAVEYDYTVGGKKITDDEDVAITSKYPLSDVEDALTEISYTGKAVDRDLRVDPNPNTGKYQSNRAIYVRVDGAVDLAAGAYIYLLHNKNYKKLSSDKDGVFYFEDKKGNTLYYQDKIFKGVEYLALVVIGSKGLIFVVNRHGKKDVSRIAWMMNDKGYITDARAKTVVKNGLIHTTDIVVNDETFEATCTVKSLKVHKTKKRTNRYVPVLFLDTLKVSTIEQTAEEVYATGGRGNANLIGWDYGKEITLSLEDALFTPASMSAIFGSYEGNDFRKGVKETKSIDRMEKVVSKRDFIVPAGNSKGTPTEADKTAQAVFYDPATMEPYEDGTPIAEGEIFYKYTRSIAYEGQSIGHTIEISADKFPGTYKVVGDTYVRSKETGEDERFQFVIPQAKKFLVA